MRSCSLTSILLLLLCRYISKSNLQYLLGDEFEEAAIDEIMREAAPQNGQGISFADFMAQWNDDKEDFEREWRKHMIPEVIVDHRLNDSNDSDHISVISSEGEFDSDTIARVLNFSEGKMVSERKHLELSAPTTKSPAKSPRKVKFQEDSEPIPSD